MRHRQRALVAGLLLATGMALAGCQPEDMINKVTDMIPDNKKPLPGERREVFPQGVPGVPQGVPPELMKGYQPAPEATATPSAGVVASTIAPAAEPKPAEKPKPKKRIVRPRPVNPPTQNQAAAPPATQQPQQAAAPWPTPQAQPAPWPSAQPAPTAAWPAAPPPAR